MQNKKNIFENWHLQLGTLDTTFSCPTRYCNLEYLLKLISIRYHFFSSGMLRRWPPCLLYVFFFFFRIKTSYATLPKGWNIQQQNLVFVQWETFNDFMKSSIHHFTDLITISTRVNKAMAHPHLLEAPFILLFIPKLYRFSCWMTKNQSHWLKTHQFLKE